MIDKGKNSAKKRVVDSQPEQDAKSDTLGSELDNISELARALGEQADAEAGIDVDPLAELAAENAALQDRLLRAAADMENLRRRTEREKAEATLYAASSFARDMLNVSDNMDRALGAVDDEQRKNADEITRTLLEGVELVQRELLNIFEKHGIRRLDPVGERFDPNLHQAMFELPDSEAVSGTVLQVVQPGFMIGERVLRPAMVGVARGGPKPDPANGAEPGAEDDAQSE